MNYTDIKELADNVVDDVTKRNPAVFGRLENSKRELLKSEAKSPAGNKYHVSAAEDRTYAGRVFASKKEAQHCADLDLLVKAGVWDFYLMQVPFILPGGIVYRADFVPYKSVQFDEGNDASDLYYLWNIEVHEVKGYWTPDAKNKMKLFKKCYPNLRVVII
mgnify:CR=1 FL=1